MKALDSKLFDTVPLAKAKGLFGVEIEVEGHGLPAAVFGWDVHKEGSLRGEAKEYVTAGAVTYDQLSMLLDMLTKSLKDHESRVFEDSYRASTHIHVNVQQRTYREIIGAILAFTLVEPMFMRLCGDTRDGNLFCLPSYDCGDLPEYFSSLAAHLHHYGHIRMCKGRGKYSSLNFNNLTKLGTLEFRTFKCSVQKDKIMKWAGWCDRVVDHGASWKDMNKLVEWYANDPIPLLSYVFEDEIAGFSHEEIAKMADIGVETAFEAVRQFEWTYQEALKKAA